MDDLKTNLIEAGYKALTIERTMRQIRALERDGVVWETVTSADLMRRCHGKPQMRYSLCRALRCAFPNAEAKWPEMLPDRYFKPSFCKAALAQEIGTIPGLNTSLIDLKLVYRAMVQPSDADALDADTLYMKCWCVAFKGLTHVPPRVRAMVLFRWGGDREIIEVFRRMAQSSVDHGGRNTLLVLLGAFYKLCVLIQPSGNVSERIKSASREEIVDLISSKGTQSLKSRVSPLFYQFERGCRWRGLVVPWQDWRISKREVGYSCKRMVRERHSFTAEELQKLFDTAEADAWDSALLRYYIHTSRRSASARELLVEDVWDATVDAPRTQGVVLEKFNRRVRFPIDHVLGPALARHIRASGVTRFVFPSPLDHKHKWCHSGPHTWLRNLCARAGITGTHIYVHGLRHTVATLLHQGGNSIEDISSYLGHKDTTTTQIYIDRTVSRPHDRMAIPWLTNPADMVGLCISSATIAAVAGQTGRPGGSNSSSSSSTSGLESVMLNATQDQQQLVLALTRRLAEREEELQRQTDVYNFIIGQVLTDTQRLTVGEWQKTHTDDHAARDAPPTWQEMLAQTYNGSEVDSSSDEDDDDEADGDDVHVDDE